MRKIRNCISKQLQTGVSKCQIDFGKIKGAIVVEHGVKLPAEITSASLDEMCHADRPNRAYPIFTFVEYAKDGGEPQVSAVGYGSNGVTNVSPRTDTFTMDKFSEALNAALLKTMNTKFDVYYFDEKNILYGYNDGTDLLAGIPLSTIYPKATPHPTSSAKSLLDVSFCLEDSQDAMENFDYVQLSFDPKMFVTGLTNVSLVLVEGTKYKIIETIGGYDRTSEFGASLATNATTALEGVTAVSYNSADETITITVSLGATPKLKKPSVLYPLGIKGIEHV